MNTGRYVLSQIIELVERKTLSRLVARYGAEERVRHFKCRQQFICMVFAQMTSRDGLRDIAKSLMRKARPLYAGEDLGIDLDNTIYALDSSTIDLSLTLFPWADFRQTKAGIKMHTQIDLRGPIPSQTCLRLRIRAGHDTRPQ